MDLKTGIIIKTNKYKEKDKIAFILTNERYDSYLIRASYDFKSKNYSYSNELTKIDFDYNESKKNSFDIVSNGKVNNIYKNIKSNYEVLEMVAEMLSLVSRLAIHVTNYNNLYDLLDFCLNNIELNYNNINICLLYSYVFKLKMLYLLGVGPNFRNCTKCNVNKGKILSIEFGGLICNKCSHELNAFDYVISNEGVISIISILYLGKFDALNIDLMTNISSIENNINFISEIGKFINLYYKKYLSL